MKRLPDAGSQDKFFEWLSKCCELMDRGRHEGTALIVDPAWGEAYLSGTTPEDAVKTYREKNPQDEKPKAHRRIEDKSEALPRIDAADVAQALGAEDAGPAPQRPWPVGIGDKSEAKRRATKKRIDAAAENSSAPRKKAPCRNTPGQLVAAAIGFTGKT